MATLKNRMMTRWISVMLIMMMVMVQTSSADLGQLIQMSAQAFQDRPERAALEPPTVTSYKIPDRNRGRGIEPMSVQGEQSRGHIPPVVASRSPTRTSGSRDYKDRYTHIRTGYYQPTSPLATASSNSRADNVEHYSRRQFLSFTQPVEPPPTPHLINGTTLSLPQESAWVPPVSYGPPSTRGSHRSQEYPPRPRSYPRHPRIHGETVEHDLPPYLRGNVKRRNPYNSRGRLWDETRDHPAGGLWDNTRQYPNYPQGHQRDNDQRVMEDSSRRDTFGHRISEDLSHLGGEYPSHRTSSGGRIHFPVQNVDMHDDSTTEIQSQETDIHITNHKEYHPRNRNNRKEVELQGSQSKGGESDSSSPRFGMAPTVYGSRFDSERTKIQNRGSIGDDDVDVAENENHRHSSSKARGERKKNRRRGKNKKRGRKNRENRKKGRKDKTLHFPEDVQTTIILPFDTSVVESLDYSSGQESPATLMPISTTEFTSDTFTLPSGFIFEKPTMTTPHLSTEPVLTDYHNTNTTPYFQSQFPIQNASIESITQETEKKFSSQNHAWEVKEAGTVEPPTSTDNILEHIHMSSVQSSNENSSADSAIFLTNNTKDHPIESKTTEISASIGLGDGLSQTSPSSEFDLTSKKNPLPTSGSPKTGSLTVPPTSNPSEVSIISFTLMKVPKHENPEETLLEDINPRRRGHHQRPIHKKIRKHSTQRLDNHPRLLSSATPREIDDGLVVRTPFRREESKTRYNFPVKGFMIITGIMGALGVFTLVVLISYAIVKCSKQPVVNNYQVSEQKTTTTTQ